MGEGRILWVDTAKTLGIFLVFWGHTLYSGSHVASEINRAIYSFHMPMFFVLSGYVVKTEIGNLGNFINKKYKRIILPALFFYVLTLPLFFFHIDVSDSGICSIIESVFYVYGELAYDKPVWFFVCLFQIYILSKIINLSKVKAKLLVLLCTLCLILSCLSYMSDCKLFSLFGFNKCILGLFFYTCGMMLKRTNYRNYMFRVGLFLLPVWLLTGVILNSKISMYDMSLGCFSLFIISSLTGTLVFFPICKVLEKIIIIREYAKWTVFIVSSHYILVSLLANLSSSFEFDDSFFYDIISFSFVIISFVIYYPICKWGEKNIPLLMGR